MPELEQRPGLRDVPVGLFIRGVTLATIAIALVAALHFYIGMHLIPGAGLHGLTAMLSWALMVVLFFSIPGSIAADRLLPADVSVPMHWVAHVWLGAFAILITTCAVTDLGAWGLRLSGHPISAVQQAVAITLLAGPALVWGFLTARGAARIERVDIPLPGLHPAFEGFRIAQVSDIHIGPTLRGDFLARMVGQVNGLEPDVVAITGDLVDGPVDQLRDEMDALSSLRAKEGTFFVTGNHEYYHGAAVWEDEVRRHGITVLHNAHQVLVRGEGEFVLGGVTDHSAHAFGAQHTSSPEEAFRGFPRDVPRILLAHQPRSAFAAAAHGVDLQLSGHTHGGQIFPFMAFVRLQQPTVSGLKRVGGVLVYTSRGTGYWGPPIRLGPRPEITLFTLRRA